jgi:ACS family hexuronate transporter-like MFS transporter
VCLFLAALTVAAAGVVPSLTGAVVSMSAAIFFIYLTGAAYWAIIHEVVDRPHIGAVSGFVHLIANCAGIVGPTITGFIVQTSGIFKSAFLLAGAFALLGALLVAVFIRTTPEPNRVFLDGPHLPG